MELPLATIERIMRNAGAERLSDDAVDEMQHSSQEIAEEVAQDAVAHMREEGRDTLEREDVRYAIEH